MRFRFRGPSGGGSVELAENVTVADLLSALKAETGAGAITIKFGWPLQTLAAEQGHIQARELGLQRENLTIVPIEDAGQQQQQQQQQRQQGQQKQQSSASTSGAADVDAQLATNMSYGSGEDVKIEMPESRTNLGAYRGTPACTWLPSAAGVTLSRSSLILLRC